MRITSNITRYERTVEPIQSSAGVREPADNYQEAEDLNKRTGRLLDIFA